MATVMAEMYDLGDKDHNEKLEKREFIRVIPTFIIVQNLYGKPITGCASRSTIDNMFKSVHV